MCFNRTLSSKTSVLCGFQLLKETQWFSSTVDEQSIYCGLQLLYQRGSCGGLEFITSPTGILDGLNNLKWPTGSCQAPALVEYCSINC